MNIKQYCMTLLTFVMTVLARATVARYAPGIVGVTGSVGKTSTKEAIRAVLSHSRNVRAPAKSFNNELGLPLTVIGGWSVTGGAFFWMRAITRAFAQLIVRFKTYPETLVLEYGVDHPGDMRRLLSVARPQIGVFTSVGTTPVHVEFFSSPEAVLREKMKLFEQLPATGCAIVNADDPGLRVVSAATRAKTITYGFASGSDIHITNYGFYESEAFSGVTFKLTYGGSMVPVRIAHAVGKTQAYAAAAAAAVGLIFGMNLVAIADALSGYEPPKGRLRLIPGIKQALIIDDTYNASPIAVEEALQALRMVPAKRRIAVLGDMLELGKYTLEAHETVGRTAAKVVDTLVTVGTRGKFIAEAAIRAGISKRSVTVCASPSEAGRFVQEKMQKGDVVLVKASQGVRLERVVEEIMAEPMRAHELLVRQDLSWRAKSGMYDEVVGTAAPSSNG